MKRDTQHNDTQHNDTPYKCYYAECRLCWLFFMVLSVANKLLMLNVIMANVVMLIVVMLRVMAPFKSRDRKKNILRQERNRALFTALHFLRKKTQELNKLER